MRIQKVVTASILLLFVSLGSWANEFGDLPEVKAITQGQPKDVAALIERIAACNHWSGEEPYDKARAEEIEKAEKKAKCDRIDTDTQALQKKYKGNKKVALAIEKAKNLVM
jgi:hypothetical protein